MRYLLVVKRYSFTELTRCKVWHYFLESSVSTNALHEQLVAAKNAKCDRASAKTIV